MLTDTIIYDCIAYLLQDKTNEENLECLCELLRSIGKELDIKACEKVCLIKKIVYMIYKYCLFLGSKSKKFGKKL